jgi:hypothetical protein
LESPEAEGQQESKHLHRKVFGEKQAFQGFLSLGMLAAGHWIANCA